MPEPRDRQDAFLGAPDPAIGQIVHAHTNWTTRGPKPLTSREGGETFILACALLAPGFVLAFQVDRALGGTQGSPWVIAPFAVLIAPTAFAIAWALWFRARRSSWVGTEGVAVRTRGFLGERECVVRFEQVGWLDARRKDTEADALGGALRAYLWTTLVLRFRSPAGRRLLALQGSYRRGSTLEAGEPAALALAAEESWLRWRRARAEQAIARGDLARFRAGGDVIAIGRGRVEIIRGARVDRINAAELERMNVARGGLELRRVGARAGFWGIGAHGVFRYRLAHLRDADLLIELLERELAGQRG